MSSDKTNIFGTVESQVLYHITNKSNAQQILAEGLKPNVGTNSKLCSEEQEMIYLTDKESIPYWVILLDIKDPVLLEVRDIMTEKFQYSYYAEYQCSQTISPEHITLADQNLLNTVTVEYMKTLCEEYIYTLSILCLRIIDAYTYDEVNNLDFDKVSALLGIVARLDYSCAPLSYWKEVVQKYGESGEYTFCDRYCYNQEDGHKLFEQMVLFPEDEYLPIRQRFSDIIKTLFPGCEEWETGGWTG